MILKIEKEYIVTITTKVTISAPAVVTRSGVDEDGFPDEDVEIREGVNVEGLIHDEVTKIFGGLGFEIYDYEEN